MANPLVSDAVIGKRESLKDALTEGLIENHHLWLSNQNTVMVIRRVREHRETLVKAMGANVPPLTEANRAMILHIASSVKAVDNILELLTNTDTFIKSVVDKKNIPVPQ